MTFQRTAGEIRVGLVLVVQTVVDEWVESE